MKPNFYKQIDKNWSKCTIKGVNLGASGCGPTAIANVASVLVNKKTTPKVVFKWMVNKGYVIRNVGSTWQGITDALKHFGITKFTVTSDSAKAKSCLKKGHWLIGVVGRSRWTSGGHFITLYNITSKDKLLISDSASYSDYRQKDGPWREYRSAERMQWIDIDPSKYNKTNEKKSPVVSKEVILYVSDAKANVRKGRGTKFGTAGILKRGTKLILTSYKDGWYQIKSGKFKGKFIEETTLSKYKPHVAKYKTLYAMNVRNGYTTKGTRVLKVIGKGSVVKSSKKRGDWIYVPALKGWICVKDSSKTYLKKVK